MPPMSTNLGREVEERRKALARLGYNLYFLPDPENLPTLRHAVIDASGQGIWYHDAAQNKSVRIYPGDFKEYQADAHWQSSEHQEYRRGDVPQVTK